MRITQVETILLTGPCTNDPFLLEARKLRSAAFIRLTTDVGVLGHGETYAGYFVPEMIPEITRFFEPMLVGQAVDSPADIDLLTERMSQCGAFWCRVGLGRSAISGIEGAMWDLLGKAEGKPVCELLAGGKPTHDRLPGYATGGPSNYPLDRLAAKVDHYRQLGFNAIKVGAGRLVDGEFLLAMNAGEAADVEAGKAAFIRKHAGDVGLLMDGHMDNSPSGTWSRETALAVLRAVEPYDLVLFEEPLPYTDPWGYAELARSTSTPVAGGECLTGMYEWRVFAEQESFDIAQPDAGFMGGLSEFLRVSAMFAEGGKQVATHAWGAAGVLMQNIHAAFATPNAFLLEIPPDFAGLHADLLDGGFAMDAGDVLRPTTPGLGIRLTDEIARRYPFQPGSGEFNSVPGKVLST